MRLIKKSEFAEMCGVSQPAIHRATQNQKLAEAVVNGKIDLDHHQADRYLKAKQEGKSLREVPEHDTGMRAKKNNDAKAFEEKLKENVDDGDNSMSSDNIKSLGELTLNEFSEKFRDDPFAADYLKSVKLIEDIEEKRLKNEERRGELISRDLVMRCLFNPVNEFIIKCISEGSRTAALDISELNNPDHIEIHAKIQDFIESYASPLKKKMRNLVDGEDDQ